MGQPELVFPNYLQLRERSRIPQWFWQLTRSMSLIAVGALLVALVVAPDVGLTTLWGVIIPAFPLLFLLAPGLWRNICPLAAMNQLPRRRGFSRARTAPPWLKEYAFVIGFGSFFLIASSRKWLFNTNGPATAVLIVALLGAALLGGYLLKGKSGWCSSLCPLLPVQRLYNQTPFITLANSHCDPCVGCAKNCYDFNPSVAYLSDLYDDNRYYSGYRRFFAAAMPGFVAAYFLTPNAPAISLPALYTQLALGMALSVAIFYTLDAFLKVSTATLTALAAASAFNLFYWFSLPPWLATIGGLLGLAPPLWLAWLGQAGLLALTLWWLQRTFAKEPQFVARLVGAAELRIAPQAAQALRSAATSGKVEVTFAPNQLRFLADQGRTLLEVAENNNQPIEAGCRMGMCGADPVTILEGMEHLSPAGAEERSTLERLGLGGSARMACMCRVSGPVSLTLTIDRAALAPQPAVAADYDARIQNVVIIGNGIAGVTAADYVRRRHPDCAIHLVGRERHHLYNRMAITRLIYGRSAMSGLYLQPEAWYDQHKITCWLNTQVTRIDREASVVQLATGDVLSYDRLILACGSGSALPPIGGFGMPGTYLLREADDAMQLRGFVQAHSCRRAVIGGGGLLGLEAAYALRKLGLEITVLERSEWLLRRQLDARGSRMLQRYLEGLGIMVEVGAEAEAALGEGRLSRVRLKDGHELPAEILIAAVGIRPTVELAVAAGLAVERALVVDATMASSDPRIFAAGDVCAFQGQVPGLWPVAVEQARVAAINATGGSARYEAIVPVTALKVAGVDLTSIGRVEARGPAESEIVLEDAAAQRYRKLVLADGVLVGAILLGYPQLTSTVSAAAKAGRDLSANLDELRAGHWECLDELAATI